MKTATNIAVLALVVLTATACIPEPELVDADWGARRGELDPFAGLNQNSATNQHTMLPTLPVSYRYDSNPSQPSQMNINIGFPAEADILRLKSAGRIQATLKEILEFWTWDSPATLGAFDPDVLIEKVDYTVQYVEAANTSGATIVIRLNNMPAATTSGGHSLIAKINHRAYAFSGGLRLNIDHPSFDQTSLYQTLSPGGTGTTTTNVFRGPIDQKWTLTLNRVGGNQNGINGYVAANTTALTNVAVAELTGVTALRNTTDRTTQENAIKKIILDTVFNGGNGMKVQEYRIINNGSKTWTDASTPVVSLTVNEATGQITTTFTPSIQSAYRVWATGMDNLVFGANGEYGGVPQRLVVKGNMLDDLYSSNPAITYEGYHRSVVTGQPAFYYTYGIDGSADTQTIGNFDPLYLSDTDGRNVVILLRTTGRTPSSGTSTTTFFTPALNKDDFKKYFRIGYARNVQATGLPNNSERQLPNGPYWGKDLEFIRIQDVSVQPSDRSGTGVDYDELRIVLDPDYRYNSAGRKYFFISPDVQLYQTSSIRHGNFAHWYQEIDGIPYFDKDDTARNF